MQVQSNLSNFEVAFILALSISVEAINKKQRRDIMFLTTHNVQLTTVRAFDQPEEWEFPSMQYTPNIIGVSMILC